MVLVLDAPAREHVHVGQELAARVTREHEHLRAGHGIAQQDHGGGGSGNDGHAATIVEARALCARPAPGDRIAAVPLEDGKGRRVLELHSARAVAERIDALADELARALAGRSPLLVVIAEGARRFASELARRARGARARAASRSRSARAAARGTELREVVLEGPDASAFRGRDVVITDDIADEGRTLEAVDALVRSGAPRSVRIAVLVSKPGRRRTPVALDHVGFEVGPGWVVGYGMDLDGALRELDWLGVVEGTE